MTNAEIDALKGRELDVTVAVALFGWERLPDEAFAGWSTPLTSIRAQGLALSPDKRDPFGRPLITTVPRYSYLIGQAWPIVEKMDELSCDFTLEKAGTAWYATWPLGASGACDSAPVAICRGALRVMQAMEGA